MMDMSQNGSGTWWVMRDSNSRPSRCKRDSYLLTIAFLRVCVAVITGFYPKQPKIAQDFPPNLSGQRFNGSANN